MKTTREIRYFSPRGCLRLPGVSSTDLIKAIAFAADRHRNQRRKDVEKSRYINHPIALANLLVAEVGIDERDVVLAAILHDTIEDTKTKPDELMERFGPRVTAIVLEVTDDKKMLKEDRKLAQIAKAAGASREAKLVKLADKICNLRDLATFPPADWPLERKQEYFDWSKRVVDQLRGTDEQMECLFDQAFAERP